MDSTSTVLIHSKATQKVMNLTLVKQGNTHLYPLSASPTEWSSTPNSLLAKADKLFNCVRSFCGVCVKDKLHHL